MIYINDKEYPLIKDQSVTEILGFIHLEAAKGVAIAINEQVIPRKEWSSHMVKEHDRLIIIQATQGG